MATFKALTPTPLLQAGGSIAIAENTRQILNYVLSQDQGYQNLRQQHLNSPTVRRNQQSVRCTQQSKLVWKSAQSHQALSYKTFSCSIDTA